MARSPSQSGQILAFVAVTAVAAVAMAAFVLDVGSWFRAHRATQAVADAAALAGAQALPGDTSQARAIALDYAAKNGGGVQAEDVQFSSSTFANDTIAVRARRTSPGYLSRIVGVASVSVSAQAQARAYNIAQAQYVAPFAVNRRHPYIEGSSGCPCFGPGNPTTIVLDTGNPSLGAFKVMNVDGSSGGIGQQTLADWITRGYQGFMGLGWYYSDPGAKFNPSRVGQALSQRVGSDLLFPVYDQTRRQGASYQYRVVGWIGFHLTGYTAQGANGSLTGYFTRVVWQGIESSAKEPFFGATVVKLVG
ncbi:MAG: hypothetical protein C4305_04730 [Thermoleophilia bacterium]